MNLKIDHDLNLLAKDLNNIERQALPKALQMAQNRTLSSVRVEAQRQIQSETGLKQKNIKDKLIERPATQQRKVAELDAREGKAWNLIANVSPSRRKPGFFNKRMKSGKRKGQYRAEGVEAKAWGVKKVYKGSFIINSKRGPIVVRRGRGSRLEPVHGPSVRQTFIKEQIITALRRKAKERLDKELPRALSREAGRIRRS